MLQFHSKILLPLTFFFLFGCGAVSAVPKTVLTWINGIGYTLDHMDAGQREISKLFGGKQVKFCYNPTAMAHDDDMKGYLGDLTQAGAQKLGRITSEVDALVKHLKEAVAVVGRKGRVIHIAHSQGALVTALAAKRLTPLEMSQIEVLAFGGAAALRRTAQTPFHRCVNYYSVNDPLLFVVPSAEQALRSGFVVDEEFCFLAPRLGDPLEDHQLLGPTYAKALYWEGRRFERQYQSVIRRSTRSTIIFMMVLMEVFSLRLKQLLRAILRPILFVVLRFCIWAHQISSPLLRNINIHILNPLMMLCQGMLEFFRLVIKAWKERYFQSMIASFLIRSR